MLEDNKNFQNSEANEASRENSDTDSAEEADNDGPTSSEAQTILETREKKYNQEQLHLAYEAVQNGMPKNIACKKYGISRTSLNYRLKKKLDQKEVRVGPKCFFSRDEEMPIVNRLHGLADAGFAITGKLVRTFVGEYVIANQNQIATKKRFPAGQPSKTWSARFFKTYPELEQRSRDNWACYSKEARATGPVATWFSYATRYLEKVDGLAVLQNWLQIFTVDYVHLQKKKFHIFPISCLFGANAYGELLPPLVLYPHGKKLPSQKEQSALHYSVAHQDTEETAGNALYQWLSEVFQPWLIERNVPRPVILFIDGQLLQLGYLSSEFCNQHQIILVSLLPLANYTARPLNAKLFGPMKELWREEVQKTSKDKSISVDDLLNSVLNQLGDTENIIRDGFCQSQIFPWNPDGHAISFTPPPPRKPIDRKLALYREMFESRLPVQQLTRFQTQRYCDSWQGPVEETCLFQMWRDLQNEIDGTEAVPKLETDFEGSAMDVKPEEEGQYFELEMVTIKQEEPDDVTLDFVKEEPSADDEGL